MRKPSLPQFLQILLLTSLVANLILFLAAGLASIAFPYDLNYGEAPLLDQARRAAAGQLQYKSDFGRPPFVIDNYPPVYPLLVGTIGAASHLPLLQVGRGISLLAGLIAGVLVGLFAWRLTDRRHSAVLAIGLFLGNLYVLVWAPLARVDMLGLALSLAGLWLVYRGWRSWFVLCLAILCLVAAAYTRQTYALAAPVASVIWLWHNDRRKSVWFTAMLLLFSGSLFLVMNALTSGGFYLNTVFVYRIHSYQVGRAATLVRELLILWPMVIAVAGVAIVGTIVNSCRSADEASGRHRQHFVLYGLTPYTLGALISVLAAGKIGSDVNYLLEPIAALAIWAALGLAWWPGWRRLRQHHAILLLTGQVLIMLLLGLRVSRLQVADKWARIGEYGQVFHHVQTAAQGGGPILADEYLGMVVRAGYPIYYQSFDYQQLYVAGYWDPGQLISEIKARRFPLIMLTGRGRPVFNERWDPSIVAAIDASYCPFVSMGNLVLYQPSTSPCAASP